MDVVLLGWLWIVLHISGAVPVHTDLHGRRFISVALIVLHISEAVPIHTDLHGRRFIGLALDCSPYIKGSSITYRFAWTSFYWGGSGLFLVYYRYFQYRFA